MDNMDSKWLTIVFVLVACAFFGQAQSAYKGGKGDGYDMAEVAQFNVKADDGQKKLTQLAIYPSVLAVGEAFWVEVPDEYDEGIIRLQVISMAGETIHQNEIGGRNHDIRLTAPQETGLYFVEMKIGERTGISKIVVK